MSYSSMYGRVVSQSHCCATPQEYEWAKNSPHFIIFFRLCVSKIKHGRERRRGEKRDKSRATIFCLRKPWLKIPIFLERERNFHTSVNYSLTIPHDIIEKFVEDMFYLTIRVLYFYFSYKWELSTFICKITFFTRQKTVDLDFSSKYVKYVCVKMKRICGMNMLIRTASTMPHIIILFLSLN